MKKLVIFSLFIGSFLVYATDQKDRSKQEPHATTNNYPTKPHDKENNRTIAPYEVEIKPLNISDSSKQKMAHKYSHTPLLFSALNKFFAVITTIFKKINPFG